MCDGKCFSERLKELVRGKPHTLVVVRYYHDGYDEGKDDYTEIEVIRDRGHVHQQGTSPCDAIDGAAIQLSSGEG